MGIVRLGGASARCARTCRGELARIGGRSATIPGVVAVPWIGRQLDRRAGVGIARRRIRLVAAVRGVRGRGREIWRRGVGMSGLMTCRSGMATFRAGWIARREEAPTMRCMSAAAFATGRTASMARGSRPQLGRRHARQVRTVLSSAACDREPASRRDGHWRESRSDECDGSRPAGRAAESAG